MRDGMELLLAFLRGSQSLQVTESEGLDLLHLAEEENLLPWITSRLSSMPDLPAAIAEPARAVCRESRQRSFLWSSGLRNILMAFHQQGIPVISVKGPWLAERLYGDSSLRFCSDLDLLVRPGDIRRAEDLLIAQGFSPCGHRDDRHRPWRAGDLLIELHHQLENPLDFDLASVWDRVRSAEFHGAPALLLSPPDELLFLSIHALRHCFERLGLIFDLAHAFACCTLPDASAFGKHTEEMKNILTLSWMMTQRLGSSAHLPRLPPGWLERRVHIEETADRLWGSILLQPSPTPNWRTTHRLYLEIEAPGWDRLCRRARAARILSTRIIEDDFRFAARFQLTRKWQVWMLRPLRLLLKSTFPANDNRVR
jgi:hypothetical protein